MTPKEGDFTGDGAGSGEGEELQEILKVGKKFGTALCFSSAPASDEKHGQLWSCHISIHF